MARIRKTKENGYSIRRFNDTNLFIAKTIDDRFVVLVREFQI